MSEETEAKKLEEMKRSFADGLLSVLRLRAKRKDKSSIDPLDVYFASLKLGMVAEIPKGYAKMPSGYYTKRLTDALEKPNSATPHLAKQMQLFANPQVGLWTKDPNALARGWLSIVHAINADDDDIAGLADREKKERDRASQIEADSRAVLRVQQDEDLPKEIGTKEAARILKIGKDLVLKYMREGILPFRNIAAPSCKKPTYRFLLADVLKLRMNYQFAEAPPLPLPKEPRRRSAGKAGKFKHLQVDED